MNKGYNQSVNYILRYIGEENLRIIEEYILHLMNEEYIKFNDPLEIDRVLGDISNNFLEKLSLSEMEAVKSYTGYHFREINAVLRNNWNYEVNGKLTDELRKEYLQLSDDIRKVLCKANSLSINMCTYRGVSIDAFSSYGIKELADLKHLEGRYLYESGFISTSMIRNNSFFYNESEWGPKANIEIEYFIPNVSDDGILVNNESLSYSPNQNEFLINSSSLFKVLSIEYTENNTAKMQVMLIPKKIWNKRDYEKERENITHPER